MAAGALGLAAFLMGRAASGKMGRVTPSFFKNFILGWAAQLVEKSEWKGGAVRPIFFQEFQSRMGLNKLFSTLPI